MYQRDTLRALTLKHENLHKYLGAFGEAIFYQELEVTEAEKREYFYREMSRTRQLQERLKVKSMSETERD